MVQFSSSSFKRSTFLSSPLSTILLLLILCILAYYTLHSSHSSYSSSNNLRFQQIFLSTSTNYTLSSYLRALTLHSHLAGTKPSWETVNYVQSHFNDLELETHTVRYKTLLSYPLHSSLSLHLPNGTVLTVSLSEPDSGPGSGVVVPYHAYSPSGSAHAKPVFVNYGRDDDYRALARIGVNVSGCIVIARRCDFPRGSVVERAEAYGAQAVLLYAERGEEDRFRNGVERGTVMRGIGDPLTPGWASVDGSERLDSTNNEVLERFPKIPSLPLSAEASELILGTMAGESVPVEWRDSLPAGPRGLGLGPVSLKFSYQGERKVATIHNVFAVIKGSEEPDRYVLLGNHRDAWSYGAVDPNSGTAALLDIARRFALLRRLGWNPRRTIILCSWDAEEFGMIGSTEWVEQNLVNLGSKAVAYLNVDCAVEGPGFFAGATPQLDNLLLEVTAQVKDPDSEGMMVFQTWVASDSGIGIDRLSRVNSDFAAFLHHAGVPSIDVYYGRDFPVYHTYFDSYDWMTNYGDPMFHRHVTVASIWGLLALRLADDPILPFDYLSYANQLQVYVDALSKSLDGSIKIHPLNKSIQELVYAAQEAEGEVKKLRDGEIAGDFVVLQRRAMNDRLMLAERGFLDADGLQGRPWFKHLVYGPSRDPESKVMNFPGIADAITGLPPTRMGLGRRKGEAAAAAAAIQHEIWRTARAIQRAARALRGGLLHT